MELKNKKILIISTEAWGENFVSKHHYARELSRHNLVYFLNPPASLFALQEINENLKIIDYVPIIRGINRLPSLLRDFINLLTLQQLKKRFNLPFPDIVWSFDPFRLQNLKLFKGAFRIYHSVDLHDTPLEKEITESAHLILTTCDFLRDRLISFNQNIHNIGHGVSENFLRSGNRDTGKSGKLKACMMGNLQRKIDYPVLFELIEQNPEVEFHFIGPYEPSNLSKSALYLREVERLRSFPNTQLHGSIPHDQLPGQINQMDLFIILYREDENPAARANPHKLLEYLSTGKIILSYPIQEYDTRDELLIMTGDKDELLLKFKEIITRIEYYNYPERMNIRKNFAKKFSYGNLLYRIDSLINQYVAENN